MRKAVKRTGDSDSIKRVWIGTHAGSPCVPYPVAPKGIPEGRLMRKQQAYYWVFAVKDGTIWLAMPERKPGRSSSWGREKPDEDGIFRWSIDEKDVDAHFTDFAKVTRGATIATCLNVKRLLRETVSTRLDRLEGQLAALREQLTRVEEMVARGMPGQDPDGK